MFNTREEWLHAAADRLNELIGEHTELSPTNRLEISTGWPRNDRKGQVIGQCWKKSVGGGKSHIFISPLLGTATDVLPVLLHELIHAADDCSSKAHGGAFRKGWKAVGFTGKPTTSVPGKELKATLREIAGELGKYPHRKMNPALVSEIAGPKQVSRQLKVECPGCGCICRMSRKAIDEIGTPTCACGTKMEEA